MTRTKIERNKDMQVAINPDIYGPAQSYAEREGLNLTTIIEDFLVQLVSSPQEKVETKKPKDIKITPIVARLKTGRTWDVPKDEDLDNSRYEYLMEKYK